MSDIAHARCQQLQRLLHTRCAARHQILMPVARHHCLQHLVPDGPQATAQLVATDTILSGLVSAAGRRNQQAIARRLSGRLLLAACYLQVGSRMLCVDRAHLSQQPSSLILQRHWPWPLQQLLQARPCAKRMRRSSGASLPCAAWLSARPARMMCRCLEVP